MSNGDDAKDGDGVEALQDRLDGAAEDLEAAETETDLDEVADHLDAIEEDVDAADLPVPDDEEKEEEEGEEEGDLSEALEDRISELRADLEVQRGPYVEDVTAELEGGESTLADSELTEDGESEAVAAVEDFLTAAGETLEEDFAVVGEDPEAAADALAATRTTIAGTSLHPDEDAEPLDSLLSAAENLTDALEAAEVWSDLTVREQLDAQGFYDVLDPENRKDFPPEWNAIKLYARDHDPAPILEALESFESDFMEENTLDALEQFAPEAAFEALHSRAQRRSKQPIRILGRIGDERACETLEDFLGGGDVALEKVTLRALGAIGSDDSTQAVANRIEADNPEVRSLAARALGLIGDTRAVEPLSTVLAEDDADKVRASAAWALNQIGTERALEVAAEYADDRSYLVQSEAEKAAGA